MKSELKDGNPILTYTYATRHGILLLNYENPKRICAYFSQLPAMAVINEVQRQNGRDVEFEKLSEAEFQESLVALYQQKSSRDLSNTEGLGEQLNIASLSDIIPDATEVLDQDNEAPIIKLISGVISEAIRQNASDIHFATNEHHLTIKFRIDGTLREVARVERRLSPLVVSRAKVMAKLDIAEKRIPQDGRISIRVGGRDVDLRVSTMPASFGERIVMRILDKKMGYLSLEQLGLSDDNLARLHHALSLPHGIILATGPTGSGKSTMLYAGLSSINDGAQNILTIEDPIEYQLEGIGQTQVNVKAGMTFAKGLRSMLRQDPDVIMVGEIRDEETIRIAIQASLTGHLVLSTLHTNTAVGAITRLEDMGVEPFLISSTLSAVIAQRLVRVLCPHCKEPYQANSDEAALLNLDNHNHIIFKANDNGCEECSHQGYKGRTALYEVVLIDDELRKLIHEQQPESELIKSARKHSRSLQSDGYDKIKAGITTFEEVNRVARN
ncbi:type II secretion system ATPase GspE [Zhongshania borealis]|uniref:Type II secretion system protein E n=1 Tax=Zhongshania borealis TaxID=889488 RepID=A0ABP7X8B2_9GAMM